MMKRFAVLLLAISIVFVMCACGAQKVEETEHAPVETEDPTAAPTDAPASTETLPEDLTNEGEARALTNYYVTVLDEKAQPVIGATLFVVGADSVSCVTDETGVAVFSLEEGEHTIGIEELPFGYVFATETREFAFESGEVSMIIEVRQTFSEPDDMDMEDGDLPIEELPEEDILIPEE